ncbi:MAG: hypothetical protein HZA11_02940 [Nitrospirae bacterium]|nr:hypothetical protein [Nitrospirota bacterium]
MIKHISAQSGLSIVATILALLIFSLFIAVAVSLVTTGAHIGVQEEQGDQAFYIADGGIQYVLAYAQDTSTIPNYSTHGQWIPLGAGEFKVDTLTYLTSAVAVGDTTINVDSTANFPSTGGRITIDTDFNITYTGTNPPNQFTGVTVTTSHSINNSVYPSAKIFTTIPNDPSCAVRPTIDVDDPLYPDDTGAFDIVHPLFIDNEYFLCSAKIAGAFQNCQRCYLGSAPAAHPTNRYASQYILTSTGRVTNFLSNNVQRVVKISAGPHEE